MYLVKGVIAQRIEDYYRFPLRCEICSNPIPCARAEKGAITCGGICARDRAAATKKWKKEKEIRHASRF